MPQVNNFQNMFRGVPLFPRRGDLGGVGEEDVEAASKKFRPSEFLCTQCNITSVGIVLKESVIGFP